MERRVSMKDIAAEVGGVEAVEVPGHKVVELEATLQMCQDVIEKGKKRS